MFLANVVIFIIIPQMMYFSLKTWIQQKWTRLIGKWNTLKGSFKKACITIKVNHPID